MTCWLKIRIKIYVGRTVLVNVFIFNVLKLATGSFKSLYPFLLFHLEPAKMNLLCLIYVVFVPSSGFAGI